MACKNHRRADRKAQEQVNLDQTPHTGLDLMPNMLVFQDYEERETRFSELTGVQCPALTAGTGQFIHDVILWKTGRTREGPAQALFHSEPSLNLVFPTVGDEL